MLLKKISLPVLRSIRKPMITFLGQNPMLLDVKAGGK
jgi:hypothetical protein